MVPFWVPYIWDRRKLGTQKGDYNLDNLPFEVLKPVKLEDDSANESSTCLVLHSFQQLPIPV